jgi:squalene synthase HpnC
MPVEHYENFPVASFLLPRNLRPSVEVIYAFARSADDLADEGHAAPEERLAALTEYELALDGIESGSPPNLELFRALAAVIEEHHLPLHLFRDLLSAFKQDVLVKRYATFEALLDYCRRSANPVGALMLRLYNAADADNMRDSDAICSALQLINFWQDVAIDWQKSRVYLPLEDMARFGVTEAHLQRQQIDAAWRRLMHFQVERVRSMMLSGAPLACRLPGRIGWELRLVVQGGLRILERIESADYDIFRHRPKLGKADWAVMLWRALLMRHE